MKSITVFFCLFGALAFSQKSDSLENLVKVKSGVNGFEFDIRYATSNNFMKQPVYPCAYCLLRPEVAKALSEANAYFCTFGYHLKLFDCYRPLSVQKKMWKIFPNAHYLANPYTKKSVHNRGAAVDLTLVDDEGCALDMGTGYDYFGKEAHQDFTGLSKEVLKNRKLLREGMRKFGFRTIRTEWWHYDYKGAYQYPVLDIPLPCPGH